MAPFSVKSAACPWQRFAAVQPRFDPSITVSVRNQTADFPRSRVRHTADFPRSRVRHTASSNRPNLERSVRHDRDLRFFSLQDPFCSQRFYSSPPLFQTSQRLFSRNRLSDGGSEQFTNQMPSAGRTGCTCRTAISAESRAYYGNFARPRRRLAPAISARFGSGDDASGPFAKLASLIPTPSTPKSPTTATPTRESSSTGKGESVTGDFAAEEAETQVGQRARDASDTGMDGGASAGRDSSSNELQQQQQQQQQQQAKRQEEQVTKRTQQQPKQQQKQQQQVEGEGGSAGVRGGSRLEGVRGDGKGGATGAEGDSNGGLPGNRQKRQRGEVAAGSSQGGVGAVGQERGAKSGQKEKRKGQAGSGLGYVDQLRMLQAQMQGAESKPAEIKSAEVKSTEKQQQQEVPFESTQTRHGTDGRKVEAVPVPTEAKRGCCSPMESKSTCAASPAAATGGAGSDVTHADISEYYGKTVQKQADLQTSACLVKGGLGEDIRRLLSNVHDEILAKFYGCGSPIPPLLKVQWCESEGCTVLDLGCGTGRDVYVAAQLVGPTGQVIGVDMTGQQGYQWGDEQLAVARKHEEYHREKFGFAQSNVSFRKGFIEDLKAANVEDSSVDVVVSNCTINLTPIKLPVFSEIARVLKPGGELYFSDIFADRRIPQHLRQDKVLFGEGFSGAHYLEDFRRLMASVGLGAWGVVEARQLHVDNPKIAAQIGPIKYYSFTVRGVKLPEGEGEDLPENYRQTATYSGSIPERAGKFTLDDVRVFKAGVPTPVDATTAAMLTKSRYSSVFTVTEKGAHQGVFTGWPRFPASVAGAWWSATVEKAKSGCC
ncbi:unnamed protein product [Closterium sp. Yama58-4]|nr:unnamed protein product [Closterium sp. Yama58-4]